jgi:hypothetical protein
MSDRALRDELERLQAEVKGLEAELAAEHAPKFLEKREALKSAVKEALAAVLELERTSSASDVRLAELQQRVDGLAARSRAVEQSRLSAPPVFVLAPLAFLGLMFVAPRLQFQIIGVTSAAVFGLLFGTRLSAWALGRREVVPKPIPIASAPPRPALFSAIFAGLFAALASVGGVVQLQELWGAVTGPELIGPFFVDSDHYWSSMPLQFASLLALLLASRVHRLSRDTHPESERSALVIATLATVTLGIAAASWVPVLQRALKWRAEWGYALAPSDLTIVAAYAPLIPALLLLLTLWLPRSKHRWAAVASLACALSAAGLSWWYKSPRAEFLFGDSAAYHFAGGSMVLQLALLGAALAQGSWLGRLACLGALGLTGLRFFGVF